MLFRITLLLPVLGLSSCGFSTFAPTLGGGVGAGVGSIGGPAGAVGGGLAGAALGQIYKESKENSNVQEAVQVVQALTADGVNGLLELKMKDHQSGFEEFTATVKKILMIAACFLGLYLLVPIFVARRCSKNEAEKNLTRIPFPTQTRNQTKK